MFTSILNYSVQYRKLLALIFASNLLVSSSQEMVCSADSSGRGVMDLTAFLGVVSSRVKDTDAEEDLYEAFRVFDRDGTGFISTAELEHVMSNLGEGLEANEISDMMAEADVDKDGGRLNYTNFVQMMLTENQPR